MKIQECCVPIYRVSNNQEKKSLYRDKKIPAAQNWNRKRLQRYELFLFPPNFRATFFIFISKKAFQTFVTPSKHHETPQGTYHKEKTK